MPPKTSFGKYPRAWKNPVYFTPRDNHVSLAQHCKFGSCLRVAIGHLEYLAENNPQRCVYANFDPFVKACNAKQRKKGMKEFQRRTYEDVFAFLRHLDIIADLPRRAQVLVNFDGCEKAPEFREGWIVAPHDFLTHRHDGACHFVGFGHSPDYPFKPTSGPKIWVPQYGPTPYRRIYKPDIGFVWLKEEVSAPCPPRGDSVSTPWRVRVGNGVGNRVGESFEQSENIEDTSSELAVFPAVLPAPLVLLMNLSEVSEPNKKKDREEEEDPKQTRPSLSSQGSLTSLKPKAQLSASREVEITPIVETSCAAFKTVREYFKGSSGIDLLVTATDGEFQFHLCKDFKNWPQVYSALEGAVEKYADLQIRDRKSLAVILSDACNRCRASGGRINKWDSSTLQYPKALFRIMKDFQEHGGALQRVPSALDSWTQEEWLKVWPKFREAHPEMEADVAAAALRKEWDKWKPA
jgi:hypothetical protein